MSPAEKQAREAIAERKMQEAETEQYNKYSSVEPSKDPRNMVRGQKGYAKGGAVGSASKRADGCAVKGKTKGRII